MMNRRLLLLSSLTGTAGLVGLSGCASPSIEDFANQKPTLDLPSYFNGMVDAWGIFTDLSLIHIPDPTRLRRISYAVLCWKKKPMNSLS